MEKGVKGYIHKNHTYLFPMILFTNMYASSEFFFVYVETLKIRTKEVTAVFGVLNFFPKIFWWTFCKLWELYGVDSSVIIGYGVPALVVINNLRARLQNTYSRKAHASKTTMAQSEIHKLSPIETNFNRAILPNRAIF